MSSRISNLSLHASIAQTEILRALQDVENMWARANRRLADAWREELPKAFYTADEWDQREQEHAEALAAARPEDPEPGSWADVKQRRAAEKAHASVPASPYAAFAAALSKSWAETPDTSITVVDMIRAVLEDKRFATVEMVREALKPVLALAPRSPFDAARARHVEFWLTTIANSWAGDREASVKLLREAIDAGVVVELPSALKGTSRDQ